MIIIKLDKMELRERINRIKELDVLMKSTEKACSQAKKLLELSSTEDEVYYKDGAYSLAISEHSDGSGKKITLNRYSGNKELMEVVLNTLERQLEEFTSLMNKLVNL